MKLAFFKIARFFHLINSEKYKRLKELYIISHSEYFCADWYIQQYPYVKKKKINPAKHYLLYGWKKGENPSEEFDGNLYLETYPDVAAFNINPLVHWELHGKQEGRQIMSITQNVTQPSQNSNKVYKDYFFSVIVTSYNYQNYIKETLDSLVAQTYQNFEVIVVDDGSKDNSVRVIKKYVQKYPFIKLYQHKNGVNKGLPETVKLGIDKAQGEYIAFCESDDYWTPNHLEEVNKKINSENNVQIIVNDVQTFGDENRCAELAKVIDYRKKTLISQKGIITDEQFSSCNYILTFSACCVYKKLLKACNFLDVLKKTALDWWLWRQICYKNRIFYLDKKLTYCRAVNSTDSSAEDYDEFIEKLNHIMNKHKYDSVYQNNGRLSDINDFKILEFNLRRNDIIQKIKAGDFSNINICYISTTGQTNRPIGDGSTRYRSYHPAETLSQKGAFVTVVPHTAFLKTLSYYYDIYIFHRPCMAELPIIKTLKDLGKILIADYDDLIFGNQKVAMQSSIFKNLGRSIEQVTKQFQDNMTALLQFDYISVSTEGLKKEVELVHPDANVFVVHNFIPESILKLSETTKVRQMPKDKNLLMYCTGTLSHNMDFREVEDVLWKCLNKDKNLKLFIFGVLNASEKFQKSSRVFFHNVVDYWNLFESMSPAAFTMAPLEISRFNECKSNVKFLESSVAGATLFATPIGDMKRVEKANIQLCSTNLDWENTILNRHNINIEKNIKTNFDYLLKNCSITTFINEFKSIFSNMEF